MFDGLPILFPHKICLCLIRTRAKASWRGRMWPWSTPQHSEVRDILLLPFVVKNALEFKKAYARAAETTVVFNWVSCLGYWQQSEICLEAINEAKKMKHKWKTQLKVASEQTRHCAKAVSSPLDILGGLILQIYAEYIPASAQHKALLQWELHSKEKQIVVPSLYWSFWL